MLLRLYVICSCISCNLCITIFSQFTCWEYLGVNRIQRNQSYVTLNRVHRAFDLINDVTLLLVLEALSKVWLTLKCSGTQVTYDLIKHICWTLDIIYNLLTHIVCDTLRLVSLCGTLYYPHCDLYIPSCTSFLEPISKL